MLGALLQPLYGIKSAFFRCFVWVCSYKRAFLRPELKSIVQATEAFGKDKKQNLYEPVLGSRSAEFRFPIIFLMVSTEPFL